MPSALTTMPNFSNRTIKDGRYQLTAVLGSGSYGVVYRAVDLHFRPSKSSSSKTPPKYAVKVLCKAGLSDSAATRVRREVAAHCAMSGHPNVITLHDAFEDTDYIYIVLDYCPGGDLFGKIRDNKLYFGNDALVKSVFLQILDAVETCHQQGIYHRDLKPENILASKDGSKIYLTDFGLASGSKVSQTFGCGSVYYMSPECIGKEAGFLPYYNDANDVWALGVILVNIIASRCPWGKAVTTDESFCDFLLHENYLREMLPVSEGANRLFRQIFAYDPTERITIPALRKAILELDTLFMTDDEILYASDSVRAVAEYCGARVRPATKRVAVAAKEAKVAKAPKLAPRAPIPQQKPIVAKPRSSDVTSASDASSSALDSNGPVTPLNITLGAQDPEVQIPELDIALANLQLDRPSLWKKVIGKAAPRRRGFMGLSSSSAAA